MQFEFEYLKIKTISVVQEISQMYLGSKQNNNLEFKINESRYLLRIKIDQIDPSINFPSGLFFKGVEFKDNGLGNDKVKDDGIYTSIK